MTLTEFLVAYAEAVRALKGTSKLDTPLRISIPGDKTKFCPITLVYRHKFRKSYDTHAVGLCAGALWMSEEDMLDVVRSADYPVPSRLNRWLHEPFFAGGNPA